MNGRKNILMLCSVVALAVLLVGTQDLAAANYDWNGSVGDDFGTGGNWTPVSPPGGPVAADNATFDLGGSYTVTFGLSPTNSALNLQTGEVTFESGVGGPYTYTLGGEVHISNFGSLVMGDTGNPLNLDIGDQLRVYSNGSLRIDYGSGVSAANLRIGAAGSGTLGEVFVDNASDLTVTGTGDQQLGWSGAEGRLTLSNSSTGNIAGALNLAVSNSNDSTGLVDVQSGSTLTLDNLLICTNGKTGQVGRLTVTGADSTVAQTGASVLTLGADSVVPTTEARLEVYSSGEFTSGTGMLTVNRTGVIDVAGGTFNANGDIDINGGEFTQSAGGTFNWADNKTMTVQNAGTVQLADYNAPDGSTLAISGAARVSNTIGYIGRESGSTGAVTVSGAGSTWTNSSYLLVGREGDGTLDITNEGAVSNAYGYIGYSSGSTGAVTVSGDDSTWTNSGNLYIGHDGDGTLDITNGGAVSNAYGCIGYRSSTGAVTVSGAGSTWTISNGLDVGLSGDARLDIADGGLVEVGGDTYVARYAGSAGAINFDDGALTTVGFLGAASDLSGTGTIDTNGLVSDVDLVFDAAHGLTQTLTLNGPGQDITVNLSVDGSASMGAGYGGSGSMHISDGPVVQSPYGYLGYKSGSTGAATVSGAGSTWTNSSELYVGYEGDGALEITDGGVVSNTIGEIGYESGSTGAVTVSGVGSIWTNSSELRVGGDGDGTLEITDGGAVSNTTGEIGYGSDSTCAVTVSGAGSTWTNSSELYVGESGNGTLDITDGGVVRNTDGCIGYDSDSTGAVTVSGAGATWTNSSWLDVGYSGDGALDITDGGAVSNTISRIGCESGSTGAVTVSGAGAIWTNSGGLEAGRYGEGTLDITNGGSVSNTEGIIGHYPGSTGAVTVSGAGSTWANSSYLFVGYYSDGALDITNGGGVSNTYCRIGFDSDCTGAVTVSGVGATWTNSSGFYVGYSGDGTLDITNGGAVSNTWAYIGFESGSTGAVTVSGAGARWTNSSSLDVGYSGDGTLDITNGAAVSNTWSRIGEESGSTGAVTVSGAGARWANSRWLYVGRSGDGTLDITNGGAVSNTHGYLGDQSGSTGAVTVQDAGSSWTNSGSLYIGGSDTSAGGTGELTVSNGGTVNVTGTLKLWPGGTLNINGGSVSAGPLEVDGGATLNFTAGSLSYSGGLLVGAGGPLGENLTLNADRTLTLDGTTTIDGGRTLTLNGGRLSTGSLQRYGGFAFNSGTFGLTGDDLVIGGGGLLGSTVELSAGQAVEITNTTTVSAEGMLTLGGGALSSGELVNEGIVRLESFASVLGGATVTNRSEISGEGRISAVLVNESSGQVRAGSGRRLMFSGSGNTNAGLIEVIGGEVEFTGDLTNAVSTGLIAGSGATLRFKGGLTNNGSVALSFGRDFISGDIDNTADGRIVVSGNSEATFYGDVSNAGVIQVSGGSTAVFFGDFTGNGCDGTGEVFLEGDTRPGFSPGEMSFGGDVAFGPLAGLQMELGGTVVGDEYDQLAVAGSLTLGGTLHVVLIDEFAPDAGDTFDILDWDTLGGAEFDAVVLPDLVGRKVWDTSDLYDTGEISVAGMLDGDTDVDWDVDSFDLANLVTVFGSEGDKYTDFNEDGRVDLADFALMRANFGVDVGSSPGGNPEAITTPEPATAVLLLLGLGAVIRRRKK